MDENLRREIIMENYLHPTNRKEVFDKDYKMVNTRNVSCIDNLDIYVKFQDGVIEDIAFNGEACAISISATSIMINNLKGKTKKEAINYINNFYQMTNGEGFDEDLVGEGIVYSEIYKQGNRKTCATLPFRGLEQAIRENEG